MRSRAFAATRALTLAANAGALAQAKMDAQFRERQQTLAGTRLLTTDRLQKQRSLSASEVNTLMGWSATRRRFGFRASSRRSTRRPKRSCPRSARTEQYSRCPRDRQEFTAWIRSAGQAHKDTMPEPKLIGFLDEQEAQSRTPALGRLRQCPQQSPICPLLMD